jgi:hypothetical protein
VHAVMEGGDGNGACGGAAASRNSLRIHWPSQLEWHLLARASVQTAGWLVSVLNGDGEEERRRVLMFDKLEEYIWHRDQTMS